VRAAVTEAGFELTAMSGHIGARRLDRRHRTDIKRSLGGIKTHQ